MRFLIWKNLRKRLLTLFVAGTRFWQPQLAKTLVEAPKIPEPQSHEPAAMEHAAHGTDLRGASRQHRGSPGLEIRLDGIERNGEPIASFCGFLSARVRGFQGLEELREPCLDPASVLAVGPDLQV